MITSLFDLPLPDNERTKLALLFINYPELETSSEEFLALLNSFDPNIDIYLDDRIAVDDNCCCGYCFGHYEVIFKFSSQELKRSTVESLIASGDYDKGFDFPYENHYDYGCGDER